MTGGLEAKINEGFVSPRLISTQPIHRDLLISRTFPREAQLLFLLLGRYFLLSETKAPLPNFSISYAIC